jgi:hypothetical protein
LACAAADGPAIRFTFPTQTDRHWIVSLETDLDRAVGSWKTGNRRVDHTLWMGLCSPDFAKCTAPDEATLVIDRIHDGIIEGSLQFQMPSQARTATRFKADLSPEKRPMCG